VDVKVKIELKAGMWKRKLEADKFCRSRSTLKKEAGSGSELGSI